MMSAAFFYQAVQHVTWFILAGTQRVQSSADAKSPLFYNMQINYEAYLADVSSSQLFIY